MTNELSPITDKEYPKFTENNNIKRKKNRNKTHKVNDPTIIPETQIIQETPLEQLQEDQQQPEIGFLSPSLVTNITKNQDTTPQSIDVSTPNKDNDIDARLEIHQIKIIPQKQQQEEALKIINQLHQMAFRDTRYLSNAIKTERNSIIALAMYYRLGRYARQTNSQKGTRIKTLLNYRK